MEHRRQPGHDDCTTGRQGSGRAHPDAHGRRGSGGRLARNAAPVMVRYHTSRLQLDAAQSPPSLERTLSAWSRSGGSRRGRDCRRLLRFHQRAAIGAVRGRSCVRFSKDNGRNACMFSTSTPWFKRWRPTRPDNALTSARRRGRYGVRPVLRMARRERHSAAVPGLPDRPVRIIPAVRSRLSRPVGFDRRPVRRRSARSFLCRRPDPQIASPLQVLFPATTEIRFTLARSAWRRRLFVYQTYRIFTDGSAIGNPGPGGWGVVLIQGPKRWELSGASLWTTVSEMELAAAIQALRTLPDRAQIDLHSDSEYLIYGMRTFVFRWQRQGWRNRRGSSIATSSAVDGTA